MVEPSSRAIPIAKPAGGDQGCAAPSHNSKSEPLAEALRVGLHRPRAGHRLPSNPNDWRVPPTRPRRRRNEGKIFISYSRKDIAFARSPRTALKARGFEPLIDRSEIYAFEDW